MERLDLTKIANILTLRYDPRATTTLPPVTWRDFSDGAHDAAGGVEDRIKSGISDFILAKKPKRISLALSGGTDSVLALIFIREMFPELKIQCISFGFMQDDLDTKIASDMASKYDADFKKFFLNNFFSNLPKQVSIIGEPKTNYYWYDVAKEAKKYSDILVTGDGGDELFSGYVFRYKKYLDIVGGASDWMERAAAYLNCHNRDWVDGQEQMFGPAVPFSWSAIYRYFRPFFDNRLSLLQQVFLADYNGKLARDWVPAHARIYSSLGMSGFSPFLSDDVIRHAFAIGTGEKYDHRTNVGKLVLRKILRKKDCPLNVTKKGFTPDYNLFWDRHGKKITEGILLGEPNIIKNDLVSEEWVRKALNIVSQSRDIRHMNRLLHLVSFEVWYRLFISKDMDASATL